MVGGKFARSKRWVTGTRDYEAFLCYGFSAVLGILFIVSAVEHLKNPFYFYSRLLRYEVLSGFIAGSFATILPAFQLVLGASLILGLAPRASLSAGIGILLMFVAAQSLALTRGLSIECGCFGPADHDVVSLSSIGRTGVLLLLNAIALRLSNHPQRLATR
jgi:hypothetical protein